METSNPYQASQVDSVVNSAEQGSELDDPRIQFWDEAKAIFLAWERLRLIYNGVLTTLTLGLAWIDGGHLFGSAEFWFMAIGGGLIVNACFFAGPIVETYLAWLGIRYLAIRRAFFLLGTLAVSAAATLAVMALSFGAAMNQQ